MPRAAVGHWEFVIPSSFVIRHFAFRPPYGAGDRPVMTENPIVLLTFLALAAYLVGSLPFGYLIGRAHGVDIRTLGSRNVGATNVGRVLGRKWGYLCFALDVCKGLLPVLLAGLYLRGGREGTPDLHAQVAWLGAAFGAIAGHIFPVWLRFRGGKGVATSLGVLLGFYPYFTFAGLAALALWAAVALTWRYVSLASMAAAAAFPLLFVGACLLAGWPIGRLWPLLAFAVAIAGLVILRHRANIGRLLAGTENRIGQGHSKPER
jgi:glycerol-3-phosphate acyltransferase PlsY